MRRPLIVLVLFAVLALAIAGCGSDDSSTTEATAGAANGPASGTAGNDSNPTGSAQNNGKAKEGEGAAGSGSGKSGGGGGSKDLPPAKVRPEEFKPVPGGDNSIQEYGEEASGDEEDEISEAMFAFFRALARRDYPAVCDGITAANRQGLERFLKLKKKAGSCETVLEEILVNAGPEAERAAAGAVYQVRVEDGNAFILFTPAGGKASYFVMKEENGEWKSTSISTGTPFNPIG